MPTEELTDSRLTLVASLVREILALGTMAPEASVTVPRTMPVPVWDQAAAQNNTITSVESFRDIGNPLFRIGAWGYDTPVPVAESNVSRSHIVSDRPLRRAIIALDGNDRTLTIDTAGDAARDRTATEPLCGHHLDEHVASGYGASSGHTSATAAGADTRPEHSGLCHSERIARWR